MIDPNKRRLAIGGSDVAALFGVDDYKDAFGVWAAKKGGVEQEPNDHMLVGTILEPAVLALYARMTERDIEHTNVTHQHPTRPFQVYSPDGLVRGQRLGVEAKVAFGPERWAWGWEGEDVPARVLFQCWWYMSAMDYPKWDVAALLGDGLPRIYTIERLDSLREETMLTRVREWWERYIQGDERPPFGDHDTAARWLQRTYPAHARPDMREATPEESALLDRFVEVWVEQRRLKRERSGLEIQLKEAIKDREGLSWDGHRFTWRKAKDSTTVDWKSMAIGLLYDAVKDEQERIEFQERYAKPKLGTRRIHVNHPLLNRKRSDETEEEEVLV